RRPPRRGQTAPAAKNSRRWGPTTATNSRMPWPAQGRPHHEDRGPSPGSRHPVRAAPSRWGCRPPGPAPRHRACRGCHPGSGPLLLPCVVGDLVVVRVVLACGLDEPVDCDAAGDGIHEPVPEAAVGASEGPGVLALVPRAADALQLRHWTFADSSAVAAARSAETRPLLYVTSQWLGIRARTPRT